MATIKEDYVSFEIAKLLKEKGFDGISIISEYDEEAERNYINELKENHLPFSSDDPKLKEFRYTIPTLQMAMKWLREVHNIHIIVHPYTDKEGQHWGFIFDKYAYGCWQELAVYITDSWSSYEEAVETAIKYCLENLI